MKKWWQNCKLSRWIELSSPVTLGFAALSLVIWLLGVITGGGSTGLLFSVYRSSAADFFFWPRLLLHPLGHINFSHFATNMSFFLMLGPLVEKHYGSKKMLIMLVLSSLAIALVHLALSADKAALGASGLVFMMIMLSAISGRSKGKIPLTTILVALIYLGRELTNGFIGKDEISQLAHVTGGLCGVGFGWFMSRKSVTLKE